MTDTVFNVTTQQELLEALDQATGGERIVLAPGDYGKLELITMKTFGVDAVYDSPVTIVSADPDDRASFSGMVLAGVSNLEFQEISFDYTFSGDDAAWAKIFRISDSENVTIRNSVFDGDLAQGTGTAADGYGFAYGLSVTDSSNIVIDENEFFDWTRGLVVSRSNNVDVVGNDIHSVRSDGMDFSQVNSVTIEGNYLHDFKAPDGIGDHPDMIQFWTSGTDAPSTDIVIRNNTLDAGDGIATQSIFMRNEMVDGYGAGPEMFYKNLLIEENVILNNHLHGITVGETDGLTIRKNSVLDADASISSGLTTPTINVATGATNVVIEKNATANIAGHNGQPDWVVADNAFVQNKDINAPDHFETQFISSTIGGDAEDYVVDPSSALAQLDAGASRLGFDTTPPALRPLFDITSAAGASNGLILDASLTRGPNGPIDDTNARFIWDFGDGTGAEGLKVGHEYQTPGYHAATLTVVMADGTTATAQSRIGIAGEDILAFDSESGRFMAEGFGTAEAIVGSDSASVATATGNGLDLGESGSRLSIGRENLSRLFGADSFDMGMTLRADTLGSSGEVARVHGSFILSVTGRGEVNLRFWTDSDAANLTTTGATVNDGADHDIRVAFDGTAESLQILVDGTVAAEASVAGIIRPDYPRNLDFGNPWGDENFDGTLSAFELDAVSHAFPMFEGNAAEVNATSFPIDDGVAEPGAGPAADTTVNPADTGGIPETPAPDGPQGTGETAPTPGDSGSLAPGLDGYKLDFATLGTKGSGTDLNGDAMVDADAAAIVFDGKNDYVDLNRIEQFEDSARLTTSVTFQRDNPDDGYERIVWNHQKIGISVKDDALLVNVAASDRKFYEAFVIKDAGLNDSETHTVRVIADSENDRVQVVLDGEVVLDDSDSDIEIAGAGGREWGWFLSSPWSEDFEGSISDFQIDDSAIFIEDTSLVA